MHKLDLKGRPLVYNTPTPSIPDTDPLHFPLKWRGSSTVGILGILSKMIHAQKLDTSFKMLTPHLTGGQRT